MSWLLGTVLSFMLGFAALSSEILWYRAYSFAFQGRSQVFGILLGGYLTGLAAGSLVVAALRRRNVASSIVPFAVLAAGISGFCLVPALAALLTIHPSLLLSTALVVVAAASFGALFPIVAGAVVGVEKAGVGVGILYAVNIAGSATGSLLTGLVLLDHLSLAALSLVLALVEVATAAVLVGLLIDRVGARAAMWGGLALAATVMLAIEPKLYADLYERLLRKRQYRAGAPFAHVIENRVGVIAATADRVVYGDGVYDGAVNVDPRNGVNLISQAYLIDALHPAPRSVLMIGLGSGSWATVVAANPAVEQVTVVEINPGYLELLTNHPIVEGLLRNPKVHFEIADGRRWLLRHPDAKFDMIIANTVYYWRSNATRLLSREFLEIIRAHLQPNGIYYYNTTGGDRAKKTGASAFRDAWRILNMLAVSDSPIVIDFERFRHRVAAYRIEGEQAINPADETDRAHLSRILKEAMGTLEPRDYILERTHSLSLITDDNMGNEWALPRRYLLF